MNESPLELIGQKEGATSIILVGVHGNERCGIKAFEKLLPILEIETGRVLFMYGNPKAIEQNMRSTEANLNRMFKPDNLLSEQEKQSYEYTRSQTLKKYLDQADVLLDIHASFTPESRAFIICEQNAKDIVKHLPFDLLVHGFDNVEPGGTDYYMNSKGKIGVCIECGYLDDPNSENIAQKSILSFLAAQGHISEPTKEYSQAEISMYSIYLTETDNFILSKTFRDFEKVTKGQLIGMDGERGVRADRDSIILFAQNRTNAGDEGFLLGTIKNSAS